uniref:Thyroglobulin type-1 domain-containing protein n=1 Tax=Haemonchus contortus TaxID=6289 RepID=A0A7I4YQB5_HAECO
MVDGDRPRLAYQSLTLCLLLFINLTALAYSECEKEINEDICPQNEGFDKDCEERCQHEYPHRLSSGCFLRSTGTLLSFFGIKSFICKCRVPEQFCIPGSTNLPNLRRSFSIQDLAGHSTLVPLMANAVCAKPTVASFSCRDEFGQYACAWQRSYGGDWYVAEPHSPMPFAPGEAPIRRYLVGVAKGGHGVLQLDTCPGKISVKFTNVSDGDVVLVDDLSAKFTECPVSTVPKDLSSDNLQRISKDTPKSVEIPYAVDKSEAILSPTGTSIKKSFELHLGAHSNEKDSKYILHDRAALKKRLCREGECTTIVHRSVPLPYDQICIGRLGLLQCRQKCYNDGTDGKTARCVRQREYPFNKRCLCQLRRSPTRRVDGGNRPPSTKHRKERKQHPVARHNITDHIRPRASAQNHQQDEVSRNEVTEELNICARLDGDEVCDRSCKKSSNNSSGRCQAAGDQITCRCSYCLTSLCDFEKDHECGWIDMHTVGKNYGNFSIASKQNQTNRYGISQLDGGGYAGLFRRGPFRGPIALSLDVYPTEGIDVRICVEDIQRCQIQKVEPKAWNRVRARIRVKQVDRIFLLFYNSANESRTMAMDNVSLKSGQCANV